ncbi:GNAT family N-acetyltransferase [Aeoliella sp.]|uniref:GNAT family N-acetyltransferase n=1 Tax=Aeoliella sp. TaxID=2795800 RepID=UPI003CCC085B
MSAPELQFEQHSGPLPRPLAQAIARLHIEQIAEGFLTSLGERFLVHLYDAVATCDDAVLLTARDGDRLAGMICGSTDTRLVYRHFVRRKAVVAGMAALPRLLTFERFKHVWETWRYPSSSPELDLPSGEVLNFCVSRDFQRRGVGVTLFGRLTEELHRLGLRDLKIVTGEKQESAHRFYEAVGAVLAHCTEVHRGQASRIYLYPLTHLSAQDASDTPYIPAA